jgi:thiol:disulfide interchange protein
MKTIKAALAVVLLGVVTILQGGEFVPSAEFVGAVMVVLGALFAILRKYTDEALGGLK